MDERLERIRHTSTNTLLYGRGREADAIEYLLSLLDERDKEIRRLRGFVEPVMDWVAGWANDEAETND